MEGIAPLPDDEAAAPLSGPETTPAKPKKPARKRKAKETVEGEPKEPKPKKPRKKPEKKAKQPKAAEEIPIDEMVPNDGNNNSLEHTEDENLNDFASAGEGVAAEAEETKENIEVEKDVKKKKSSKSKSPKTPEDSTPKEPKKSSPKKKLPK